MSAETACNGDGIDSAADAQQLGMLRQAGQHAYADYAS